MSVISRLAEEFSEATPAVKEGFFRFFRGEGRHSAELAEMGEDLVGRHFTPHFDSALRYAAERDDRIVKYVDVSAQEAFQHNLNPDLYESVLPRELTDRAKPYQLPGLNAPRTGGTPSTLRETSRLRRTHVEHVGPTRISVFGPGLPEEQMQSVRNQVNWMHENYPDVQHDRIQIFTNPSGIPTRAYGDEQTVGMAYGRVAHPADAGAAQFTQRRNLIQLAYNDTSNDDVARAISKYKEAPIYRPFTRSGFGEMDDTLANTLQHEQGHLIHEQADFFSFITKKQSSTIPDEWNRALAHSYGGTGWNDTETQLGVRRKLSMYAGDSEREAVAEAYAAAAQGDVKATHVTGEIKNYMRSTESQESQAFMDTLPKTDQWVAKKRSRARIAAAAKRSSSFLNSGVHSARTGLPLRSIK